MIFDRRAFLAAMTRAIVTSAGVAAVVGCAQGYPPPVVPPPRSLRLGSRYTAGSTRFVDHSPLAALLERHVFQRSDGVHLFGYGDLSEREHDTLDRYIRDLAGFPVEALDRREQYAYWLNLYNALVLRLVLSRYLVLSIRDIDFGVGPLGAGPFERKLVAVRGEALSLSDIRNSILRPVFDDPRLHYGLCDAAVGSPNLQRRVFTGERVDRMLDGAALDFIHHLRAVRRKGPNLMLSGLYNWYAVDFGGAPVGVLSHLQSFAGPGLLADLRPGLGQRYEFDWSLNDGTGIRN
ncbi:MAG: DUF547 domain-containing protein [Proteobacteria bacterium]|nr:DUF547 domain-containing protein [Pseudomonadota bacterium]MDA1309183.1 DUF547 domain-containing protein [Pseudomonadota bacterium]